MSYVSVMRNLVKKGFEPMEMWSGKFRGLSWGNSTIWFDEFGKLSSSFVERGGKKIKTIYEHSGNVSKVNKSITTGNKVKNSSVLTTKGAEGTESVIINAKGEKTVVSTFDAGEGYNQVNILHPNGEYSINMVERRAKRPQVNGIIEENNNVQIAELDSRMAAIESEEAIAAANQEAINAAIYGEMLAQDAGAGAGFLDDAVGFMDDIFPFGF